MDAEAAASDAAAAAAPAPSPADEWELVNDEAEVVASVSAADHSHSHDHSHNHGHDHDHDLDLDLDHDASPPDAGGDDAAAMPDGCLRVRLRIGERVRAAWFQPAQSVAAFQHQFFAPELAAGRRVRLIYMGMLLLPERAMGEYGVEAGSVIHCVVAAEPAAHPAAERAGGELKGLAHPANSLLLLTGALLYGLWTLFYHFPHVFSWKALALLSLFSAAHLSAAVSRFAT